jgi:hypothetical protein
VIAHDDLPVLPKRGEQVQLAKDLARQLVDENKSDDLQHLFDFADARWPFDFGLRMTFFDEIHAALTERRQLSERRPQ